MCVCVCAYVYIYMLQHLHLSLFLPLSGLWGMGVDNNAVSVADLETEADVSVRL
jgi:hypothetical protein